MEISNEKKLETLKTFPFYTTPPNTEDIKYMPSASSKDRNQNKVHHTRTQTLGFPKNRFRKDNTRCPKLKA